MSPILVAEWTVSGRIWFQSGAKLWYGQRMTQPNESPKESKDEKFEQSLERLQTLVRQLEGGELSLEDSLQKFGDGMSLAKRCQEKLSQAEQKIEVLLKATKDGVTTAPFESKD